MVVPGQGRRYRILGTIGKGGFGTVYKAEMLGEGDFTKVVALKVLNPEASLVAEVAQRLRDEARILGLVRHRAIVQVDGLCRFDNQWTIVMEYLEGVDLADAVTGGPMPTPAALEVVEEISQALHQAWIQPGPDGEPLHLLHRDIKPSNVVITAAGEVKVLDFGTARANFGAREAKTQSMAFGTIDFMSPERLEFVDLPAGDIYAVGCVMYELLTADRLGKTSPDPAKHTQVFERAERTMSSLEVHPEVLDLTLKCLAFDAEERPTAEEVARACRQLRPSVTGEWLIDWTRHAVPPMLATRGELKKDGMTGVILSESSGTRIRPTQDENGGTVWVRSTPHPTDNRESDTPAPAVPPPVPVATGPAPGPPSSPSPISQPIAQQPTSLVPLLILTALLTIVLFVVVAGGIWVVTDGFSSGSDELAAAEPAPQPAEPAVAVEPEPEPEPVEPEPVVDPEPAPAPKARPKPRPRPKPQPAPKATGTVVVKGDAASVALIDASGNRHTAGSVPEGTYTIEATFSTLGTVKTGSVEIGAGSNTTLTCSSMFGRCDVSR